VTEVKVCPLCGSTRLSRFSEGRILGSPVRNMICDNCTLVFQSPRMSEQELEAYYAGPYRIELVGTDAPIPSKLNFEHARAQHLVDFIEKSIGRFEVHLDIGCAAGQLLLETRRRFGCRVIGIEPGHAHAAHARSEGVEVHASLDEYLQSENRQRPDLVTLSHVLEHISDPIAFLRRIREDVLAADGNLLIEVPNLFVHSAFEPAHLYAYHAGTLRETLGVAGFEVRNVLLHNQPRRDPRPHYLVMVATPGAARPPRRTRSPLAVRIQRAYARSYAALAIQHPLFVTQGAWRRLAGG
jgi:SAM-dependent methyltransferase